MVRYYGRHGCKQFIRGKPVRFRYKVWSLNTPDGYLVNFEIYQGNNPRGNANYEELFGKASAPLIQMIEDLGEKKHHRYNFFFDNLFSGTNLLCTLKDNGYGATGTIRDNRIPKECPISNKKEFAKKARGSISSALEKTSGILYVRWMDNSVVSLVSTCFGVAPIKPVERFSRKERKNVSVPRPDIVLQYNKNMGGTWNVFPEKRGKMYQCLDRILFSNIIKIWEEQWMDSNVSCYRIGIRKTGRNISQLEFRRSIVQTYLTRYKNPPKSSGRVRVSTATASTSRVSDDLRYDGLHHYMMYVPKNKRRRCAGIDCNSRGRTMCCKCDVGLCIE
ncbi:Transposase IS4 [Popillia japonica]|uniref:Transposase IS4 n=1 Tax=Popillia japonica TaxID=7064 RepID=A0AAW1HRL5_POPJA